MRHRPEAKCYDCGKEHQMFAVHDHLWKKYSIGVLPDGFGRCRVCYTCFETRMDRPITVNDLKHDALVNIAWLILLGVCKAPTEMQPAIWREIAWQKSRGSQESDPWLIFLRRFLRGKEID